jgi:DNA-binding HxlR family transcriptional regulator
LLDATSVRRSRSCCARDYPGQICSIAKSLEVIGERWSLLIVRDVMNGRAASSELQKGLGSPATCSRPACSAWSTRTSSSAAPTSKPPRYEYFLTEKGLDLWPALIALLAWGDRHSPSPDGPPMLIVHKGCGGASATAASARAAARSCTPATPTAPARPSSGAGNAGAA